MSKGMFIVGTDTDVGKTIVTAGIMHVLRSNGYNATYFKAALSGAIEEGNELIPGDTKIACDVSNLEEVYENITPYVYKNAVSPHLAAKIENKPIQIDLIRQKYNYLKDKYDYVIAEGSGGIVCPLIDDERGIYTLENLIKDLNMGVVIVARAGVGTINHTVLTVEYIKSLGIKIKGIIINNYIDNLLCNDNIQMIEKLTKVPVIGKLKYIVNLNENMMRAIRIDAEKAFSIKTLEGCMDQL
ncbi:dethiobiotin synthase [Clostridium estertheticum]|uniref:dethiobiotin synthase n=1 Tax=Clostridium estertheticum TaxID=238834 RepID=UPI001C6F016F|nr:dethiobiotin synthase [Clostridium estertheticum]MBW9171511.1 dethiobiotin synthase [Clostridium estertheticum]WLC77014.1 dethiobiotin synthase [Clostridium estertheticum]